MRKTEEESDEVKVELQPLPEGWLWSNLGEVGLARLGKTPGKADYRDSGEHKIVKFRDVDEHGQVDWDNANKGYVDPSPKVLKTLKELKDGDVLVTASAHMSEHIGKKVGIVRNIPSKYKAAYVVGEILQIRTKEDFDPRWILYFLRSAQGYKAIQRRVHGVHLIASRAQNIEIPVAPFAQQKHIVAEIEKQFSRLDEAVANLKRVKANLKRYKAAVLKAAVEGHLVETEAEVARRDGRSYETGAQLLQRILENRRSQWLASADSRARRAQAGKAGRKGRGKYKEPVASDATDLPELPEGWVWASTGSLGDVIGGLTKNPKRAKLKRKLPYLRVANVYANELRLDEVEEIGVEDDELEKLLVQKGDLLIVEGNGSPDQIGRLAIWDGSISPCVHQNHLIKVRLQEECAPQWVVSWLMSPDGRKRVRDVASSTSGLYTLSVGKVSNLPVPLPPNSEQLRIIDEVDRRLSLVREDETQVDANFQRAERLRQSILLAAFSGTLASELQTYDNRTAVGAA